MTNSALVRNQFDKQATAFNDWPVTQNEKILSSLYYVFGIDGDDRLLEFACGTGAFAVYAARKTKFVQGVDISEKMIQIAVESSKRNNLKNVEFMNCDVEKVPFESEGFECVVSKSAFHHMKNYDKVFKEMKRCCKKGGRVCIEDISQNDDLKLNDYFEQLELKIDICHHKTLSRQEIIQMYRDNDVTITRFYESVVDLNLNDYINHAVQSKETQLKIQEQITYGLSDCLISKSIIRKDGELIWKRKIVTIVGQK